MKPALCLIAACLLLMGSALQSSEPAWIVFQGSEGPGKGKHIVLVAGDEEYRSEEALPQLAKILAKHHGFKCTVLFPIDPTDGTINPNISNIPGLENLQSADLAVLFLRFRNLPDDQMKYLADYIESGKPIVGLRTSTHAFAPKASKEYQKYHWQNKDWPGGFGKQVLGETWFSHHGKHGSQSCRGIVAPGQEKHPILRGINNDNVWGPTDVYGVNLPLPGDSQPLVLGQVLTGMKPTDPPVEFEKATKKVDGKPVVYDRTPNEPMMPIAWTKTYTGSSGKPARVFASTMASSQDLESEGLRRLLVNGCYWALGMEERIPAVSNVELVGDYQASPFKNNGFRKGVKPADLK